MVRSDSIPEINGEAFRIARETRSLTQKDLAHNLCLSVKHIDELENNKNKVFFSIKHRYQVAQKVADYLNLRAEEAFPELVRDSQLPFDQIDIKKTQDDSLLEEQLSKEKSIPLLPPHQQSDRAKPYVFTGSKKTKYIFGAFTALAISMFAFNLSNFDVATTFANKKPIEVKQIDESLLIADADQKKVYETYIGCNLNGVEPYPYKNEEPSKPPNYLYAVAKVKARFCVVDAQNIVTDLELESGSAKSVYGTPPFIFISQSLASFDLFYQGNKVFGFPDHFIAIKLLPN